MKSNSWKKFLEALVASAVLLVSTFALAGCGSDEKPVASEQGTTAEAEGETPADRNQAAIDAAEGASDNQAELGATKIKSILRKKLNMDSGGNFYLDGSAGASDVNADCYVKLGADAANFEDQPENILYGPNGEDIVFVQSFSSVPLVKCLKVVNKTLGW